MFITLFNNTELMDASELSQTVAINDTALTFVKKRVAHWKTGIHLVDCIGGFVGGETILVTGGSRSGKSVLVHNMVEAALKNGLTVNYYCCGSLEPPGQFNDKGSSKLKVFCPGDALELVLLLTHSEDDLPGLIVVDDISCVFELDKSGSPQTVISALRSLRNEKTTIVMSASSRDNVPQPMSFSRCLLSASQLSQIILLNVSSGDQYPSSSPAYRTMQSVSLISSDRKPRLSLLDDAVPFIITENRSLVYPRGK